MAETFTWRPRIESQGQATYRVLSVQFGDGYKQSVGDGINTKMQTIKLTFVGLQSYIDQIKAFIDARQGYQPFWFTQKGSVTPLLWESPGFTDSYLGNNLWSLSVTFNQRFDNVD